MSSLAASRAGRALRQQNQLQLVLRRPNATSVRHASTNPSEVAGATKEKASQATSKASQGLSRVTSSAGPAISKAGAAINSSLGRIGGRTGRLIARVQSLTPHVTYYSKVGLELGKVIFEKRQMSPPSLSTFQSYLQPVIHAAQNPSTALSRTSAAAKSLNPSGLSGSQYRGLTFGEGLTQARQQAGEQIRQNGFSIFVIGAEALGFFTVGTMIGRMKIVGYRSSETGAAVM